MRRTLSLALLIALSACDSLPRDPDNTLARIERTHVMRIGIVAGGSGATGVVGKLITSLERETGSRAELTAGPAEPLLNALQEGRLDLVLGPFVEASPWETEVALGPILERSGSAKAPIMIKAAMPNGANRWIMMVEHASRGVAPEGVAHE